MEDGKDTDIIKDFIDICCKNGVNKDAFKEAILDPNVKSFDQFKDKYNKIDKKEDSKAIPLGV